MIYKALKQTKLYCFSKEVFQEELQTPLSVEETLKIFFQTQIVDYQFLKNLETQKNLSKNIWRSLLQLYSILPNNLFPEQSISYLIADQIKINWNKMSPSDKIDQIYYLFLIENLYKKPLFNDLSTYKILDQQLLNLIQNFLWSLNRENIEGNELLKIGFLLTIFYPTQMNKSRIKINNFLQTLQQNTKTQLSIDQLSIMEKCLQDLNLVYQTNQIIGDFCIVQFLIKNQKKILELQLPQDLLIIKGSSSQGYNIQNDLFMFPKRYQQLKKNLLVQQGFQVYFIPFYEFQQFIQHNKQTMLVRDILKGISIQDSKLFL